jgi:8-oxo-dGTP pyrophosphatase MutT (NUDIX family)
MELSHIVNNMNLHTKLANYHSPFLEENVSKEKILKFLASCKDPFSRKSLEGHVTASGFLVNNDKSKFLLMHHRKLKKWVQPGGHCDGDADVLAIAIKETKEESGIVSIKPISCQIYDIEVYWFPANLNEKGHYHYDITFLLGTVDNDLLIKNIEANALRWFAFEDYFHEGVIVDNPIKRMIKKFKLKKDFL